MKKWSESTGRQPRSCLAKGGEKSRRTCLYLSGKAGCRLLPNSLPAFPTNCISVSIAYQFRVWHDITAVRAADANGWIRGNPGWEPVTGLLVHVQRSSIVAGSRGIRRILRAVVQDLVHARPFHPLVRNGPPQFGIYRGAIRGGLGREADQKRFNWRQQCGARNR